MEQILSDSTTKEMGEKGWVDGWEDGKGIGVIRKLYRIGAGKISKTTEYLSNGQIEFNILAPLKF